MSGPAKQSSRWGSFLQQAVAGVESRLDNILAEGDEATVPNKPGVAAPAHNATKSDDGTHTHPTQHLLWNEVTLTQPLNRYLSECIEQQQQNERSAAGTAC